MECYFTFQLLPTRGNIVSRWCSHKPIVYHSVIIRMDLLLQGNRSAASFWERGSLSPPTRGMVLLNIHPVPRCKNSTSITLTDWFAVVSLKNPSLGLAGWTERPGDLESFWGQRRRDSIPCRKSSCHGAQQPWREVVSSVPSHLSEEMEKFSAFQKEEDLLQVPLASLLTCWPQLFHPLAKKLGRNNKGCSATRQTRATWKSWKSIPWCE